jgi:hypothetical protein
LPRTARSQSQTDPAQEEARSSIENAKRSLRETDELRVESRSIGDPVEALDALSSLTDVRSPDVATRGTERAADPFFRVNFEFANDAVMKLRDTSDRPAVALTGSKIVDYARHLKLFPEFEKQLENYRTQTALFEKLVAEYDATIQVKDAKIEILETRVEAEHDRAELFKTMADARKEGFFDSFLRKAGLIVGFAAGVAVGVLAN